MKTEEEIRAVADKYPPHPLIVLWYTIFGRDSKHPIKRWFITIELTLFAIGFVLSVIGAHHTLVLIPTVIFAFLLTDFGITSLVMFVLNNRRIRKICRELGIPEEDWSEYVFIYGL